MLRSPALAKLILGAFVLYAPLCPCAALAADRAGEASEHETQAPADRASHHDAGHEHNAAERHDEAGHDHSGDPTDNCHGSDEPSADCSMSSADEADGEFAKTDRYDHAPVALGGYRYTGTVASAAIRPAGVDERTATRRPHDTPITSHDRLLT